MTTRANLLFAALLFACSDDGVANLDDDGDDEDGAGTTGGVDESGDGVDDDDGDDGESTGPLDPSLDDDADEDDGSDGDADTTAGPVDGGTPGCNNAVEAGAGTVEIDVGGELRNYILVVPEGYDPATPTPLVFGWHGRGSNADQARLYFGIEEAAAGAAIIAYPNGLPIASMGDQTGWDLGEGGIDVAFFDAMVQQLSDEMCIDPARVYSTGHSFGGYMSNALGCFRPDVLRAIGSVAGGPAFGACGEGRVAAILIHGELDEVVLLPQGEASRDALLARNACEDTTMPVDPDPCVAYDGCDAGYDVRWCLHGEEALMGHMWPEFAGPAIWDFFAGLAPE
jgi:polyhydroxybutyrate depolymerase